MENDGRRDDGHVVTAILGDISESNSLAALESSRAAMYVLLNAHPLSQVQTPWKDSCMRQSMGDADYLKAFQMQFYQKVHAMY